MECPGHSFRPKSLHYPPASFRAKTEGPQIGDSCPYIALGFKGNHFLVNHQFLLIPSVGEGAESEDSKLGKHNCHMPIVFAIENPLIGTKVLSHPPISHG